MDYPILRTIHPQHHQPKKAKTPQQKEKEYTGKEYALTFILDRLSKGDRLIVGVKKELKEFSKIISTS